MTRDEFISLVKQPDKVDSVHSTDLKELVELYPYFAPARLFYAKALQKSDSILFASNLKFSSVYAANRRWLYYYIHPEKKTQAAPYKREKSSQSGGGYFDMMNAVESEGGDTRQSLRNLAERLKTAREMVSTPSTPIVRPTQQILPSEPAVVAETTVREMPLQSDYFQAEMNHYSEDEVKRLIKLKKYSQAIEILKVLNLNNPKKSVYFADQIRFLEKIVENSIK